MKHILLCPNPIRDIDLTHTHTLARALTARGITPVIYPLSYVTEERTEPIGAERDDLLRHIEHAALIVCFGGDGTILHLARNAAPYGVPILPVNLGRRGFMAAFDPSDMDEILDVIGNAPYPTQSRMMLDVSLVRSGGVVYEGFALNDAVITSATRIIDLTVWSDDTCVTQFSGDGLVVCTPTGSTAYSMSAGGPIIEPDAKALSITPICAHGLIAKSFVLPPDRTVKIATSLTRSKRGYLSIDGGSFDLADGDEIIIRQSKYVTKIVTTTKQSFYQLLDEKLSRGVTLG